MYITENKCTVMMKTEQNIYERKNIQQRGEIHETFKKSLYTTAMVCTYRDAKCGF